MITRGYDDYEIEYDWDEDEDGKYLHVTKVTLSRTDLTDTYREDPDFKEYIDDILNDIL